MKTQNKQTPSIEGGKISRRGAIKKAGYSALSAATMMVLISNNASAGGNHGPKCSPSLKTNNGNHYGTPKQGDHNPRDHKNSHNTNHGPWKNSGGGHKKHGH